MKTGGGGVPLQPQQQQQTWKPSTPVNLPPSAAPMSAAWNQPPANIQMGAAPVASQAAWMGGANPFGNPMQSMVYIYKTLFLSNYYFG